VHDICHEAIGGCHLGLSSGLDGAVLTGFTENARFVCEEHYALFKGPPIQLLCPKDLTFAYVPGHL
jgi:hypothetical protein